jgi:hypothetical protein
MATEWIVEARAGGKCVVRVVHSLFASTDDWDNQLENFESGWPAFFSILKLYLTHFRGQRCSAFQLMGASAEPASAAWSALTGALRLPEAAIGERLSSQKGAPRLAGIVERVGEGGHQFQFLVRLDEPTTGIAHLFALAIGGKVYLPIRFYLYGTAAASVVARVEPEWTAWINERFPMNDDSPSSC